jgi:PmbA protein
MSDNGKMDFDNIKSDLLARADRGLKYGKSYNVDALEVYIVNMRTININIQTGMVDATHGGQVGVGVRSIMGKKIGFASASGVTNDSVNFAVDAAVGQSKALPEEDDRWDALVDTKDSGKDGNLEFSVLDYTSEEAVNGANTIFREAKAYDDRIISVSGTVQSGYGGFAIVNSEGLEKSSRSTYGYGTAFITAKSGDVTKDGFDFIMGRGVPEFEGIGTRGATEAVALLNAKPLGKTGEMNLVFDKIPSGMMLTTALASSINGMSVVEGRSVFADKIGDQVGVPALNVYDDAQIPEDPGMVAVDGEGFARKKTEIMEDGVLKSFIFDNYYSKVFETENTGNASRQGQQSFEALPSISSSTITINPGTKSVDQLVEEVGNGVLVKGFLMGIGHSNLISGDFSIVSPSSYVIENGEVTNPIDSITIAGNLYKSFNQITAMANDDELTFLGKIPSMSYEGFTVSG